MGGWGEWENGGAGEAGTLGRSGWDGGGAGGWGTGTQPAPTPKQERDSRPRRPPSSAAIFAGRVMEFESSSLRPFSPGK